MKLVKIKVKGDTNRFNEKRPNGTIFITYTEDAEGAYLWIVDNQYARQDAVNSFDSVEFLEAGEIV